MATPLDTINDTDSPPSRAPQGWRSRWAVLAAAAGVAAVVGTAAVVSQDDSASAPSVAQQQALTLNAPAAAPGGGTTMNSCIMFDVAILKGMPVAFGGTVTSIDPGTVTFDVDRWFASDSGRPDRVQVRTTDGATVALDGVEFTQGTRYLVTATEGNVNTCGYTGPATPELEKSFTEAFPG